jgi:hypothetical protein
MSNHKPIEFAMHRYTDSDGDQIHIEAVGPEIMVSAVGRHDGASALFTDPAKLDALADAIKRAADALRKSQQLTFADLKPGEWFSVLDHAGRCMKLDESRYSGVGLDANGKPGCWCMMFVSGSAPVTRLQVSFTPVDADVAK